MVDNLEYNSTREKLFLPEYGRNIQKMVEQCCKIKNREERNKSAKSIITAMIQIQGIKTEPNTEQLHKLWDHLFIISQFQLDADSPFEIPQPQEKVNIPPEKPTYNTAVVNNYRSYGHNMKGLADSICQIDNLELKNTLTFNLANHIKKCYLQWNRDSVTDDFIINQLRILSAGKLDLPDNTILMTTAEILELFQAETNVLSKNAPKKVEDKSKKNIGKKNKKKRKIIPLKNNY
ncbi:MAG: DUF4290 domain-containing protein [Bacteroidales bacterium]|nr:DUF4290 domain-containing protein [Bacteroidales bacterium]